MSTPHPIEAHRLMGDGRTTALIRPDAVIDWWCAPTADSPPLLWSLLDERNGSKAHFPDWFTAGGSALPAGPTATTLLRAHTGRVEVHDGLLTDDRCARIVRLVHALDDDLDITHELRLGGFDLPRVVWQADGRGRSAGRDVHVIGGESSATGGVLRTRLRAAKGELIAMVIAWGEPGEPDAEKDTEALVRKLDEQLAARNTIIDTAKLPKMLPDRARDALTVLVALADRDSGAAIASATTSLPEAIDGDRNYDYRYSWIRDAGLALSAADLLGSRTLASRYLKSLIEISDDGLARHPVLRPDGSDVPDEREVSGVEGWAGSKPIRVGNDAKGQLQYDVLGVLAEGLSVHLQQGRSVDGSATVLRSIADRICTEVLAGDRPTSAGIWELREPKDLLSADIGRWVALDRAIHVLRVARPFTPKRRWRKARAIVRKRVLGALLPTGGLPQTYEPGDTTPDASALLAIVFGLLGRRDKRASRLIDATLDALGNGPFVYRYPPGGDDGFSGREGAFLPVSWWVVSALALVGRVEEADRRAEELHHLLPRLLPEEWDPLAMRGLGNVPLLWSHAECARAIYLVDVARKRRRTGLLGEQVWRVGHALGTRVRDMSPGS